MGGSTKIVNLDFHIPNGVYNVYGDQLFGSRIKRQLSVK